VTDTTETSDNTLEISLIHVQFGVGCREMLDTSVFGKAYLQTRFRRTSVGRGVIDLLIQENILPYGRGTDCFLELCGQKCGVG
jgi:hypothetical protein